MAAILALGVLPPRSPESVRELGDLSLLAGVAIFVWAARTLDGSFTAYPRPAAGGHSRRGTVRTGSCGTRSYGAGVLVLLG